MKIISTLSILALTASILAPSQAMAGDKEKAIIGGLIGGIIIGSVLADDDVDTRVSVGYHNRGHHRSHGYWKWVSTKRWVPGYYERRCDRFGHVRRVWISGHYDYSKRKVWVEDRHGYRHSDRHDDRRDRHGKRNRGGYRNRHDDRRDSDHRHGGQMARRY